MPFHLTDSLVSEWAYSYGFSPAILEPLSSGTLLWDHLAGVNTFPTKPAWIEANVNAALNRVMGIPGYLWVSVEAGEQRSLFPSGSSFSFSFPSPHIPCPQCSGGRLSFWFILVQIKGGIWPPFRVPSISEDSEAILRTRRSPGRQTALLLIPCHIIGS